MTASKPIESQPPVRPAALMANSNRAIAVYCLGVGALTLVVASVISPIEIRLFNELLPALRDFGLTNPTEPITAAPIWVRLVEFVFLSAAAYVALLAERRWQFPTLALICLQIYLVSFIVQIVFCLTLNVSALPLTYLFAIAGGTACGALSRRQARKQKLSESRYYELIIRNQELNEARRGLVEQDEVARRLLAADLHDQVLNDLKKIMESFKKFEESPTKELSNEIRTGFSKTMKEIREIMDDLCPVMLQSFGLRAAVEDCLEKGKERSGFEINFECKVDEKNLEQISVVGQSLLFRLVQESITNICKHAEATRVTIVMSEDPSTLTIVIEDNGKGIDYSGVSTQSRGLRYMKLRADIYGARIDWSNPAGGKGTKVTISFPYSESASAD